MYEQRLWIPPSEFKIELIELVDSYWILYINFMLRKYLHS